MIYIYCITQLSTNRKYVGSSKDPGKRKHRHFLDLRRGVHHNQFLQRAYNKTGEGDFLFEILEASEDDKEQFSLEETWAKELNAEFNIGSFGGGDNLTNNPNREDIINRIGKGVRAHVASLTEEERKERWSRPGELNPNWKGGLTVQKDLCISCGVLLALNNQSKTHCNSCRDRSGKKNSFFGKKHTEDSLKKMSESSRQFQEDVVTGKKKPPSNWRKVRVGSEVYISLAAAAKAIGITPGAMHNRLKKAEKYDCEYLD